MEEVVSAMDIIVKEKTGNLQKLVDIISQSGQRTLIQMHNSPDPDSIASAYGLRYLLQDAGIQADICYRGEIEKYSTSRMVELL